MLHHLLFFILCVAISCYCKSIEELFDEVRAIQVSIINMVGKEYNGASLDELLASVAATILNVRSSPLNSVIIFHEYIESKRDSSMVIEDWQKSEEYHEGGMGKGYTWWRKRQ